MSNIKELTKDEAELYDRQIRLWGVQSQQKISSTKILVIGLTGLASEITKNLVLAGINCLTILDWYKVQSKDLTPHIFLTDESIGQNVYNHIVLDAQ